MGGGWIGRHPKLIGPVVALLAAAGVFVAVVQPEGSRPHARGTGSPGFSATPSASPARGSTAPSPSPSVPGSGAARGDDRPNLVLIVTDDQWAPSVDGMPIVQRLLADHGVVFSNAFASTPLCCPARAGILTGQYSHHTGVASNVAPDGGVTAFDDRSSLATWLQASGYQTSLVGKYLNGYGSLPSPGVPPGWDDWHVTATEPGRFFDYDLIENGRRVHHGSESKDYLTDVLRDRATAFIERADGPFFLMFTPFAPHAPATPAPADAGSYASAPVYRPPSFNEPVAIDKPWSLAHPPLMGQAIDQIDSLRRRALESLRSVDRAVDAIVEHLERAGVLDNTVIVFTSDNGFLFGEHRLFGKTWAYEPSIRVPMIVRVPWRSTRAVEPRPVLNIDLASTLAELAGVRPGLPQDGRSLLPLLRRRSVAWRTEVLIEWLGERSAVHPQPYRAVRTDHWKLIVYQDGTRELYDLRDDGDELNSLALNPAYDAIEQDLLSRLGELTGG